MFDQDAVLIHPHLMRKNILETPLENIRVVYATFFPKSDMNQIGGDEKCRQQAL